MPNASTPKRARRSDWLEGITPIEPAQNGFVVWNVPFERVEAALLESPRTLARGIADRPDSGIALDLSALSTPTAERTRAIGDFVDELQHRGTSVVLHSAKGSFLTAIQMERSPARFATCRDLAESVRVLRRYDDLRRHCVPSRGRRLHQLRMPAHALSLAPLGGFLRDRLERRGLRGEFLTDLLYEAYCALTFVLHESAGAEDISASAAVHDDVATVTILDSGEPRTDPEPRLRPDCRVDRIHGFRILDRHNALVLEKTLGGC